MSRATIPNKATNRRKPRKKKSIFYAKSRYYSMILICILLFLGIAFHYRNGLLYYLGFRSHKLNYEQSEAKRISDIRNYQVLTKHKNKAVGIDISEYQGKIDWDAVKSIENVYPIEFVLIRATAGNDREDDQFMENWIAVKNKKIIRGAYHYYRPNENSLAQAKLFIKTVQLNRGDLPPVLDIEKLPREQPLDSLKVGLRRWLQAIEAHYKVKPIIYTGEKYYHDFLREDFSDYLFWIANYNFYREKIDDDWLFWQFTEKASVSGIKGNVDVNIFNGDIEQLGFITIE